MAVAWEEVKIRSRRLLVAVLVPSNNGFLTPRYAFNTFKLLKFPKGSRMIMPEGSEPYGPKRNKVAKQALDEGYAGVAFLDSDVLPHDPETFIKLIDTGLELVGALYFRRAHPFKPAFACVSNENQPYVPDFNRGDIVQADLLPSGATLYRSSLLKRMFDNYQRPFEWGLDVANVPYEDGYVPPNSEDYVFSLRAKTLGVQGYVHTGLPCLHETHAVAGPRWILPGPDLADQTAGWVSVLTGGN